MRASWLALCAALAAAGRSLGDLPVIAVAGGRPDARAYGADAEAFTRSWGEQAAAIAGLSTRGEYVLVAERGHNLPAEVPGRVGAAVRAMLERVARR